MKIIGTNGRGGVDTQAMLDKMVEAMYQMKNNNVEPSRIEVTQSEWDAIYKEMVAKGTVFIKCEGTNITILGLDVVLKP